MNRLQKSHEMEYEERVSQFNRDEDYVEKLQTDHKLKSLIVACKSGTCEMGDMSFSINENCEVYNRWEEAIRCGIEPFSNATIGEEYIQAYCIEHFGGSSLAGTSNTTRMAIGKGFLPLIESIMRGRWFTMDMSQTPSGSATLYTIWSLFGLLPYLAEKLSKLFVVLVVLFGMITTNQCYRWFGTEFAIVFAFGYANYMGLLPWVDFFPTEITFYLLSTFLWAWLMSTVIVFSALFVVGYHFKTVPFSNWKWSQSWLPLVTVFSIVQFVLFSISN